MSASPDRCHRAEPRGLRPHHRWRPADHLGLHPADETDQEALATLLGGLSPQTAYQRFLSPVTVPPAAHVRALVRRAPGQGAWLATVGDVVVAHACWAFEPTARATGDGPVPVAELAAVTTDRWQGHGIGVRLTAVVAGEAVDAGATALRLHILADNRRLLDRVARQWPGHPPRRAGAVVTYTVPASAMTLRSARGTRSPLA